MKIDWLHLAALTALIIGSCGEKPVAPATPPATVPLQPELPAAHSSCYSLLDISKIPNLDKTRQWPPIQIPAAAKVLSRKKPVTSSSSNIPFEGELAFITDGQKSGNEGYSVILGDPGPQWVRIDLGEIHLIDAVILWNYFRSDRVVNDVIVQVCEDPDFKTGVTTLFNNDIDNTSGQGIGTEKSFLGTHTGRQIPGNGTKARYIRTWSNGSTDNKMNEFIEVEVWGRTLK